ncbi:alpha/beta hydrolase [Roseomonas marmotae]|uniref:Dienelactone hydrolase family protein n=1 Tax=Roseomonas marmotae TaxID=2768161 RepID=A0ABS3KCM2_9PROT|nr:dienelactone hydrolase family protein [Roseomonas marmotae]MBO1074747.1 dienelactone hydrolase family protein [Roseomonas marmotae]QTI77792.1 dienelactone hydrolase family protein [Roseomonas marmotae]
MATMDGPRWGPKSGNAPKMIVFLLHGLGADGNDLIDLAPYWANAVPDALFISPHAPEPHDGAPFGRQWFSLSNRAPAALLAGVQTARPVLDAIIDQECAAAGLPPSAVVLMGFSQGAMTALYTGLRRQVAPAGIMAYSGMLIGASALAGEIACRPPVLLVHGEVDQVVPAAASQQAETVLRAAGVPVEATFSPALGHGIDDAGLSAGALFLQRAAARIEAEA